MSTNEIEEVLTTMEARLKDKEIDLQRTIQPNIIVTSDAERVKQIFFILNDNATKRHKLVVNISVFTDRGLCK